MPEPSKLKTAQCGNCAYGKKYTDNERELVFCLRYPPVPLPTATVRDPTTGVVIGVSSWAVFPSMKPEGWCGEHRRRLEAVETEEEAKVQVEPSK